MREATLTESDLGYLLDRLKRANLDMLRLPALPRHRLAVAFATNLAWIVPEQFPAGDLRESYREIWSRIHAALPAGASMASVNSGSRAFTIKYCCQD